MPEKVLIYSRFPKAQMERFGERFELVKPPARRPTRCFRPISSPTFAAQ